MTRRLACLALVGLLACDSNVTSDPAATSALLDTQLRQQLGQWGAVPIGSTAPQSAVLVDLGRSLFFDKELSGNRDVACGSCHDMTLSAIDGMSLAVGTGGSGVGASRTLGSGRQFVSRNAPSMLNSGIGLFYSLWDGRVNREGGGGPSAPFKGPAGVVLPAGLNDILAAQALLPVLNRVEMRGTAGDRDVFGNVNELATATDSVAGVWSGLMKRLLAIPEYAAKFAAAFPSVTSSSLGFQHAANAIAAFEIQSFMRTNSPFDRYLARDNSALSDEEKRGALLFFGKATCSQCHSGALLGGTTFANIGVPQIGPGVGKAAPLDIGRGELFPTSTFYQFTFRAPPLRNVELTAPYMHNGAYPTLDAVVRHYTNADSAQRHYDVSQLAPALRASYHGDGATVSAVLANLDFRVRNGIHLTDVEQRQIVAFLKSLTDPSARNLSGIIPGSVPSGLPVR
jgi:cytochrome c peroxidase